MKRIGIGLAALALLGGCGVFGGAGKKPKTPVLGERIPILATEAGAQADPALADQPVAVPGPTAVVDWPQPGGNAAKSTSNVALPATLTRAWTAQVRGGNPRARLAAAPVVADGKLFAVDIDSAVWAFDAKTGAQLWRVLAGDPGEVGQGRSMVVGRAKGNGASLFGGGVSFDDGKLYVTNGIGDAVALEAATGKELWRKRPAGPLRGAPTIANGNVYVMTQDNQVYALAQATGETVWNASGTLEVAGVFGVATPAAAQGTVVTGFSSGELTAYRYENGRPVWQDALSRTSISTSVSSISDVDAAPAIDQGRVYAIGQGGRMVAMELVTGQRLWELNIAGVSTPWVAGDWVFVVTDDARLLCIARTSGKVRWSTQLRRWRKEKGKHGPITWIGPMLAGDRLLVGNNRGELVSVAAADGTVGATIEVGGPISLPLVAADGMLYVLTGDGKIEAWR